MKLQLQNCIAAALTAACFLTSANATTAASEKEGEYIRILQSEAPKADKAITCKRLAVYGSSEAVPAIAPLLLDPELTSWARIALEAIPGSESEQALRDALSKAKERVLIGIINSVAVKGDQKAIPSLVNTMNSADKDIAGAAALALGKIGGADATKALTAALESGPESIRPAVAHGCILAAEGWLKQERMRQARRVYDAVREANVPQQRQLEAVRGAILARGGDGIPLLMEQLRSSDEDLLAIGLRTARELPGSAATKALAEELSRTREERQPLILLALADRGDASAVPAIVKAARSGSTAVSLAAVGVLEKLGNASTIPVLLDMTLSKDANLSQASKNALTRLPGGDIDGLLQDKLANSDGKVRQVLLELAGKRQIRPALPLVTRSMEDKDPGVRAAAIEALSLMGTETEAVALVKRLQEPAAREDRANIETALLAISGRSGSTSATQLLPLTRSQDPEVRVIGLHALASAGGPQALSTIKAAVEDQDGGVQDEAVRTLSSWPNTWPDDKAIAEPLLALAKSGKKTSHQVLAVRGYLQHLQSARDLKPEDKVRSIDAVLPLLRRSEEKRLAVPILQSVPTADSLDLLANLAGDPAVADDAAAAMVRIAGSKNQPLPREVRERALKTALDKSGNDDTKKRAQKLLSELGQGS